MVVRFVCVVCVPLCVRVFRVSRVCPGSPRCLFTDLSPKRNLFSFNWLTYLYLERPANHEFAFPNRAGGLPGGAGAP